MVVVVVVEVVVVVVVVVDGRAVAAAGAAGAGSTGSELQAAAITATITKPASHRTSYSPMSSFQRSGSAAMNSVMRSMHC